MANMISSVSAIKKLAASMLALKRIATALKMPAGCTPEAVAEAAIHALGLTD